MRSSSFIINIINCIKRTSNVQPTYKMRSSSYAQIPQRDPIEPSLDPPPANNMVSRRGLLRTYWLAAVLCCGGMLFGYDSGVIGWISRSCYCDLAHDLQEAS